MFYRVFYRIAYAIAFSVIRPFFRLRVVGRENIPAGGAVVCANHTASSDPIFLSFALTRKHKVHFMAKAELMSNPFSRTFLKGLAAFPVRRGASDITAIKHAFRLLRDEKKLGMFPEGTRVHHDDEAQAKTGAVMLSTRSGAPFLPVWISPGRKHLFSRIDIVIGSPYRWGEKRVSPDIYHKIADELMKRVYNLGNSHASAH
ncbi:MAG: 1-acyl-sn-glycerol-3-phosphate acyltransferase [Oscillospiraceae bacterium]|nr:1-acyl-sn-glycerol-3-phosphate acyltransferase [Oscillospiraceae bacterium]